MGYGWQSVSLVLILAVAAAALPSAASPGDLDPSVPPKDLLRSVRVWAASAFAGDGSSALRVPLTVLRQDHSALRFGQSAIGTPITLNGKRFGHGLGTHANSRIRVEVPRGAVEFSASVGVDDNEDTRRGTASVEFVVEADGVELARSPVSRVGEPALKLLTRLPKGTGHLDLVVTDGGDGPGFDQADWADAQFVLADGAIRFLDDNQPDALLLDEAPPFSFVVGGKAAAELLPAWSRTVKSQEAGDRTTWTVTWTDPAGGLIVEADATAYKGFAACDWVLRFTNTGKADTPVIEKIRALDARLRTGYSRTPVALHRLQGDACGQTSFLPVEETVEPGRPVRMAPTGGRPSSVSAFPFFGLEFAGDGLFAAVGWCGQWFAEIDRSAAGPTRLSAGMEGARFVLHPGETVRTPRILVMAWRGDRLANHNRFRRLMLAHYSPKLAGKPAEPPFALQCFDRYVGRPDWSTEEGQLKAAAVAAELGFDALWLDAAWFPGGFPNGVGTWSHRKAEYPRGLKPVSDKVHAGGGRFVLWFEPERVAPGSAIADEHPEFVHGGKAGGLFKLDDPAARRWLTDLLVGQVKAYGVDVYRNDFNMDPLDYWRRADAPDRQGITEIRYVEGLYAMWDEIRARCPGVMIDNCASGGRRIEIEMCSRSVPLWRSDTGCSPGHADWHQAQVCAFGLYVPLASLSTWTTEPYETRSNATMGVAAEFDYMNPDFVKASAKEALAELRANRPYWYGDLYPIMAGDTAADRFAAWQLHLAERDAGIVLAFRRRECNLAGIIAGLRAVDPEKTYVVDLIDERRNSSRRRMTGAQLRDGLTLKIGAPGESLLVRYAPAPAPKATRPPVPSKARR